jgi:hypothetical protein
MPVSRIRGAIPPLSQDAFTARCSIKAQGLCRGSSVGIATGYGLHGRGSRVRFPAEAGNVSLPPLVPTVSGAHPASYPMDTVVPSTGRAGRGVRLTTHLLLLLRSKNAWRYTSTPQYIFMAWCLVKAQRQVYPTILLPLPFQELTFPASGLWFVFVLTHGIVLISLTAKVLGMLAWNQSCFEISACVGLEWNSHVREFVQRNCLML